MKLTSAMLALVVLAGCGAEVRSKGNRGSPRPPALVLDDFDRASVDALRSAETGQQWVTDPRSMWGIRDGAAMLIAASENARPEAVVDAGRSDEVVVAADLTLSPTPLRGNAGITYRYKDHDNYLWSKLEVSEGHPGGMLTIGKVSEGTTESLLAYVDDIGLASGVTYRIRVVLDGHLVTATVSGSGVDARVSYLLSLEEMRRFGGNTLVGLRGRLAFDEDDGLSRWERFSVRSLD